MAWTMTVKDMGDNTGCEEGALHGVFCHRFVITLDDGENNRWWNTTADGEKALEKVKAEANTILLLLNNGFLPKKLLGASETAATSQEGILEGFRWRGFQDGFRGISAAAVSEFHQPQVVYFEGFTEGRAHMKKVEHIASMEHLDGEYAINKVMKKALEEYHYRHYG